MRPDASPDSTAPAIFDWHRTKLGDPRACRGGQAASAIVFRRRAGHAQRVVSSLGAFEVLNTDMTPGRAAAAVGEGPIGRSLTTHRCTECLRLPPRPGSDLLPLRAAWPGCGSLHRPRLMGLLYGMWFEEAEFRPLGGAVRDAQAQGLVQRPPEQYPTDSCTLYDCCAVVWPALCGVVSCPPLVSFCMLGHFSAIYIPCTPTDYQSNAHSQITKTRQTPSPTPHTASLSFRTRKTAVDNKHK